MADCNSSILIHANILAQQNQKSTCVNTTLSNYSTTDHPLKPYLT